MNNLGFVRVTAASHVISVGHTAANSSNCIQMIESLPDSDIILFPELNITGYTCGDLFRQQRLLDGAEFDLLEIARSVRSQLVVVGLPVRVRNALYNCAAVLNDGKIIGIVPKEFIPNYNEFYEGRWFASARDDVNETISIPKIGDVPFGTNLLFKHKEVVVSVEICESIWMPIPPSSFSAIAGANILLNPSASNETIGKADYRRNLVIGQSGRCIAAYAYASCGPTESTSDVVFGGHCMIAENGHLLQESCRVGDGQEINRGSYQITTDVDVAKLQSDRYATTSFNEGRKYLTQKYTNVPFCLMDVSYRPKVMKHIDAHPFIPKNNIELKNRCSEIFGIQTCGLAKRLEQLRENPKVVIGVSGGLDSTLALMVAVKTYDLLKIPRENIVGVTMPGFGTTNKTYNNSNRLMDALGITQHEIDIRQSCLDEFKIQSGLNGYKPFGIIDLNGLSLNEFEDKLKELPEGSEDLIFENVQARRRTEYLMNLGFVLGTGDMSELWLGWCTFNADHQSMYNVNCSIPKTLVKFLVEYIAENETNSPDLKATLLSIAGTTISPELLPKGNDDTIVQSTESKIGPYELHDFFMFHFVRNGFSPYKIYCLAKMAQGWNRSYTDNEIKHWLKINIDRAFKQQYKRDDVPNGPKVGSVSLSPRGDWRMPSDASPNTWLNDVL